MSRTLLICKPDAMERGLTGEILTRLERKGLTLVAAEVRAFDSPMAERLYETHRGKPFFDRLVAFMTRGPSLVLVVDGPGAVWSLVRTMVGDTDSTQAAPGTVRGDLGLDVTENLVHASDSQATADREIQILFPHL